MDMMIDMGSALVPPVTNNDHTPKPPNHITCEFSTTSSTSENDEAITASSDVDGFVVVTNGEEEAPDATTVSTRSLDTMSSMDSASTCTGIADQQEPSSTAAATEESTTNKDGEVLTTTTDTTSTIKPESSLLKKAGVAVAGGTLTAVGLVMIPLPTPCGALIAASGMTLLGTEFEGANNVVQQCRASVVAGCEGMVQRLDQQLLLQPNKNNSNNNNGSVASQPNCTQDEGVEIQQQQQQEQQQDGTTSLVVSVNNVETMEQQQQPPKEANTKDAVQSWNRWRTNMMGSTRSFLADTVLPNIRPASANTSTTTVVAPSDAGTVNADHDGKGDLSIKDDNSNDAITHTVATGSSEAIADIKATTNEEADSDKEEDVTNDDDNGEDTTKPADGGVSDIM